MHRTLLTLVFIGPLFAAPALKNKQELYYPTKVGDTRVYVTNNSDGSAVEYVQVVTKVETKDGVTQVGLGMINGGVTTPWAEVDVSASGVVRRMAYGNKLDAPETVLKLPFKAGDKWEYSTKPKDGEVAETRSYTVVAEEMIEVPAGKFRAIRVDEASQGKVRTSYWHAPVVGVIKQANMQDGKEASAFVLKSFKPGK